MHRHDGHITANERAARADNALLFDGIGMKGRRCEIRIGPAAAELE
jgi:hypothetical protein